MAAGLQKGKTEEAMTRPTPQQIEAYRLCYFFDCTQRQAAKLMGIDQSNICRLLKRLKKTNSQLFPNNHVKIHFIKYRPCLDSYILDKF